MLSQGLEPNKIAQQLSSHFNIPLEKVQCDVTSVSQLWDTGNLTKASLGNLQPKPIPVSPAILEKARPSVLQRTYAFSDVAFSIKFHSSEIESIIHCVLGHCEVQASARLLDSFDIIVEDSGYRLNKNGIEVAHESSPHSFRHALVYEAAKSSYPGSQWMIFLHAGAVSNGTRCILMPGVPGCGKSTLTAALTLDGLHYLCEDIAPVSRKPWSVASVRTRICLREGGWQALKQKYPALNAINGGLRWGKRLRYITPPQNGTDPAKVPIHSIVFPEYVPGIALDFSPLSCEEKLVRLIQTGAWFSDPQDEDRIKELLAWIEATPGYHLRYHNSEEAIASIKRLLSDE
jgi:hypothetical protein